MYELKRRIFNELSKAQKVALFNYLRALVKKMPDSSCEEVFDFFIEEESYYLQINSSRFPFLADFIDSEKFIKEVKLCLKECIRFYEYKKAQEPLIKAQKEYDKKKRKFLQEIKMSKEEPTKKQISYYKSLCKRYNMEKLDVENASKLDLRNEIDRLLSEN